MQSQISDPFLFPGGETGCLLLHGFSATPHEMRFLGEQLAAAGLAVSAPRLAGHGTSLADFAGTRATQWIDSAEQALQELSSRTSQVVVVGQSMGGLVGLHLAARHPQKVRALTLLAPALQLARKSIERLGPLLPLLARGGVAFSKRGSDIADAQAVLERTGYAAVPAAALHQLLQLQRQTRTLLPQVRQPTLVIQSEQDHTCSPQGVGMLQRQLGGHLEVLWLRDSFHVISLDLEKDRVVAAIAEFIGRTTVACASA